MADYVITCSTMADLTIEQYRSMNICYKTCQYIFDGKKGTDDPESFDPKAFYDGLAESKEASTAVGTIDDYMDFFTPFVQNGKGILHIEMSSAISNGYNMASAAALIIRTINPEAKIFVVDSLCASGGIGLLLEQACKLRDEGYGLRELSLWVEDNKLRVHHLFFSSDLTVLIKDGRVSGFAGNLAKSLEICPIMEVNDWGELVSRKNVRKKERVMGKLIRLMKNQAEEKAHYKGTVFITHADCLEDAQQVEGLVKKNFHNVGQVHVQPIGPTVGLHTGRGTVAVFFRGKERSE